MAFCVSCQVINIRHNLTVNMKYICMNWFHTTKVIIRVIDWIDIGDLFRGSCKSCNVKIYSSVCSPENQSKMYCFECISFVTIPCAVYSKTETMTFIAVSATASNCLCFILFVEVSVFEKASKLSLVNHFSQCDERLFVFILWYFSWILHFLLTFEMRKE